MGIRIGTGLPKKISDILEQESGVLHTLCPEGYFHPGGRQPCLPMTPDQMAPAPIPAQEAEKKDLMEMKEKVEKAMKKKAIRYVTSTDGSCPHYHHLKMDEQGNGQTVGTIGCPNHVHKIVGGEIQPSGSDNHLHTVKEDTRGVLKRITDFLIEGSKSKYFQHPLLSYSPPQKKPVSMGMVYRTSADFDNYGETHFVKAFDRGYKYF